MIYIAIVSNDIEVISIDDTPSSSVHFRHKQSD